MKYVGNFTKETAEAIAEAKKETHTVSVPVTSRNTLSWVEMLQYGVVGVYKESHE